MVEIGASQSLVCAPPSEENRSQTDWMWTSQASLGQDQEILSPPKFEKHNHGAKNQASEPGAAEAVRVARAVRSAPSSSAQDCPSRSWYPDCCHSTRLGRAALTGEDLEGEGVLLLDGVGEVEACIAAVVCLHVLQQHVGEVQVSIIALGDTLVLCDGLHGYKKRRQ